MPKFIVEINNGRLDAAVKGDKHEFYQMMLKAMSDFAEVREAVIHSATLFIESQKSPIIKPPFIN